MNKELTEAFEKLLVEKTFTADALEGIKKLKDKALELENNSKNLQEARFKAEQRVDELVALCAERLNELNAWKAREAALIEREKKVFENEKNAAVAQAESAAFKHSLGVVFAAPSMRREVHRGRYDNQSGYDNDRGNWSDNNSHTEDETSTEIQS